MSIMDGIFNVVASHAGEQGLNKMEAVINEHIVVPKMDRHASEELSSTLLDKYGNEAFYHDFDSYITGNNVIALLITAFRKESSVQPIDRTTFIEQNVEKFLNANPKYSSKPVIIYRISEALALVYDRVYESTLGISPYTDIGRLQRDFHCQASGIDNRLREIQQSLDALRQQQGTSQMLTSSGVSAIANEEIAECTPTVEAVKKKIKDVEEKYQHHSLFTDALEQYMEILQEVVTLSGQPQHQTDNLLCTINCNIALCYSNLGNSDKALSSLAKTPASVAQTSKTYNFVFAVVAMQKKDSTLYEDALTHINHALSIDSNYHRAFMVRQHLRALLSCDSVETIIQDLDNYFNPLLDSLEKDKVAEYHLYRGMIHLQCDCFNDAIVDYENALAKGYDPIVGKLNLAIAKYQISIAGIPRDQRVLLPAIKMEPMLESEKILIDIIQTLKGNPDSIAILHQAISIYVSACTLIGKPHQLTPLSEYLFEDQNYESKRAIIMGSAETLTEKEIGMLSAEDALFCTVREMLRQNKVQECKQHLAKLVDSQDPSISPPTYNSLLQACLFLNAPADYWCYRTSADRNGIDGDLLRSYDAWAYELEGKTETAKAIMDKIAAESYDDGLLFNALRFYGRNEMLPEQEKLLLRMHNLQKNKQIYILELDDFYYRLTTFFIQQRHSGFAQLFSEFPEQVLTRSAYLRMQGKYYSEVNDLDKLISCLSELWDLEHNFTHGFDLAICLYKAMRYEEAISIGQKLEETATTEQKPMLYWLLSDANLLNSRLEESFEWAKKAHELTLQNPHDQSHQAYLTRAMACNHQEVLSTIFEYKKTHPVVVNWFHPISIPENGQDFISELRKKLEEIDPHHFDYEKRQKTNITLYRSGIVPINLLFQNYGHRLSDLAQFARACKFNIASGILAQLECAIPDEMVVDAQTLIFASAFGGIEAIKLVPHLYMNYGSIAEIQQTYMINGAPCLGDLLSWVKTANNITFVEDGFIEPESTIVNAFSKNFVSCCNIAQQKSIPYLYYDQIASKFQSIPELGIPNSIQFITIPSLCFNKLNAMPDKLAAALYSLLKYCRFVSFTSDTIVQTIMANNNVVADELIEPFMCCTSDCDMATFKNVYLGAIHIIRQTDEAAALQLSRIVVTNAKKIWLRGTHYRWAYENYQDSLSEMKATAIQKYVQQIILGIKHMYSPVPTEIGGLLSDLENSLNL